MASRNSPFANNNGDELTLEGFFALGAQQGFAYFFKENESASGTYRARRVNFTIPVDDALDGVTFTYGRTMFDAFPQDATVADLNYLSHMDPTLMELLRNQ